MLELNQLIEETGREIEGIEEDIIGEKTEAKKQITNQVARKHPMELLIMWAPLVHLTCLLYPGFYFLSMDVPILMISVFPEDSRNFFIICLCLAWEMTILSVGLAWLTYVLFTVTSFILTLKDTVDLAMRRISIR